MSTEAIASGTAAADSSAIAVDSGASIQVWTDVPLVADEQVAVFRTDGTVTIPVKESTEAVSLSKSRPSIVLNGPASFVLKKSATASATAVIYDS